MLPIATVVKEARADLWQLAEPRPGCRPNHDAGPRPSATSSPPRPPDCGATPSQTWGPAR